MKQATSPRPRNLLWLQSGGCGGCSMSLLNAEAPHLFQSLEQHHIRLLWHPSLSEASGSEFLSLLEQIECGQIPLDIFCLEGSVMMGPNGSGLFHRLGGSDRPMFEVIRSLADCAEQVLAIGNCAAFGGVTMAADNLAEATGLQYHGRDTGGLLGATWTAGSGHKVINIAGCPTHPDWVLQTLMQIAHDQLSVADLDSFNRPRSYTNHLVHHGCPRNEYYEYKASAVKPADQGCMMENRGCLGTQARADCNTRLWNGQGSCLRGGYACINCTAPEFEEPGHCFCETPKISGIPVGLPTDMPKAWFVALASLAKAATPKRLKINAISEQIRISPGQHQEDDKS